MNIYIILEVLSLKLLFFNDLPRHIFKWFYPHLRKTYNLEKKRNLRKSTSFKNFLSRHIITSREKEWVFFFQYIKHITSSWEEINYSDYIMSFAQAPKQERILNIELMKLFSISQFDQTMREKGEINFLRRKYADGN